MDLQHELSQNKPSNDNLLAAKLQFYPALRRNDLVTIKKIIDQAPHIIHLETEWPIASNTNYWPLGVTPLYWAAGMGQQAVVELLLATGADINGKAENKTRWHQGFTPLHHAIKFHQADMVDYLIAQGADPNRQTNAGLSPFHLAAICGNVDIMDRLIAAGADQSLPDQSGQTAADWARHKENREALSLFGIEVEEENLSASTKRKVTKVFPIANLIGRAIDVEGHPLDKKPQFRPKFDIDPVRMNPAPLVLETGIKLVDLFSPLKRGGSSAVFTPLSGVGRIRIQSQIMRSIIDLHNGYVVTLSLNKGEADILSQRQQWQAECNIPGEMLDTRFINFAARTESDSTEMYRLAARAALAAEQLAKEGHEVLLWIDYPFGLLKEIVMLLESYPMISPIGSVTRLYDGDFTPGQAPAYFDDLDSIISFSYERAISQLRPSIEPLTSRCRWMDSVLFSSRHRALIKRSMAYLQRYNGLKHQYEHSGRDGLFYLSSKETDEMIVETIQRLDQYLVQPLSINEFYSAQFGQYARLDTVLNDVEAILSGSTNGLAKESLRVSLTLAEAQAGS